MIRAHKIRLNPTPEQELYFRKATGTKRFVYNWALDRWQWAKSQGLTEYGLRVIKKDFNALKGEQFPWVYDVAKDVAEGAFTDLGAALKNYFDWQKGKRKGAKMGFPNYKSKKSKRQSFRVNNDKFWVDGHTIRIPRLGEVNMAEPLRFQGKIMGAVVSKVADWWYVSIQVEIEPPAPKQFERESTGVDVGVKTLATLSDGSAFENQKPLRKQINKLRKLSRSQSRRQKGSNRWWKAQRKVGRFHAKMANKRADAQHKASRAIASTYALIGVEDLHVKGMVKNRRLALAVSDVGLSEFLRQIEYKSKAFGGQVVRVGRFYASSKTCNDCGHIHQTLTLSDRQWTCQGCGTIHDRDWNAAKNIEQEALRLMCA
ncbi:MAG: transposase [Caldilinea sp. CFX5]|nr:transposase [Caldilinea sp. CFX5]